MCGYLGWVTYLVGMHVVGVGNAIVDVIATVDDAFITKNGLVKGSMDLIDTERAVSLYDQLDNPTEVGGGSAANTIVGIASLGGDVAYIGKVRNDALGESFRDDLRAAGVTYDMPLATEGEPTARSIVLTTPDAERTMNTFLGVSAELAPADLDLDLITSADVVYCEGYLYDAPAAKEAIRLAMSSAQEAGKSVAFTLSDLFCVDRHRAEFADLIANSVDILFANDAEICALYETDDVDGAIAQAGEICDLVCVTRGADGSTIVSGGTRTDVPAFPVDKVVDTTGAGDLYAAGVLYGRALGHDVETAGKFGSLAAAEVISHMGPRPLVSLAELASEHKLT